MKTAAIWSTTTPLMQHMWTRGEGRQEEVEEIREGLVSTSEKKERDRRTKQSGYSEESDKHNIMRFCYKLQLGRHTGPA